ncbi:hypothetical protein, partial [Flavonifractor plautii]|uniref:hypothetical protein n=1 Tax=Flavonifractor plautii TaxID=292800 RepID=UPI0034A28F2A
CTSSDSYSLAEAFYPDKPPTVFTLTTNHCYYWISTDPLMTLGPWVSPIRAHPFFNNLQISFESGTEMYYFFLFAAYM